MSEARQECARQLLLASAEGSVPRIESLLRQDPHAVNSTWAPLKATPVMAALLNGHTSAVIALTDAGADASEVWPMAEVEDQSKLPLMLPRYIQQARYPVLATFSPLTMGDLQRLSFNVESFAGLKYLCEHQPYPIDLLQALRDIKIEPAALNIINMRLTSAVANERELRFWEDSCAGADADLPLAGRPYLNTSPPGTAYSSEFLQRLKEDVHKVLAANNTGTLRVLLQRYRLVFTDPSYFALPAFIQAVCSGGYLTLRSDLNTILQGLRTAVEHTLDVATWSTIMDWKMPLNRHLYGPLPSEADYQVPCPHEDLGPTGTDYICSPLEAALGFNDVQVVWSLLKLDAKTSDLAPHSQQAWQDMQAHIEQLRAEAVANAPNQ